MRCDSKSLQKEVVEEASKIGSGVLVVNLNGLCWAKLEIAFQNKLWYDNLLFNVKQLVNY